MSKRLRLITCKSASALHRFHSAPHPKCCLWDCSYQHMYGCCTLLATLSIPVLQSVGADGRLPSPIAVLKRVVLQKPLTVDLGEPDSSLGSIPITASMLVPAIITVAAALQMGADISAPLWPCIVAVLVAWAHARFFRPPPRRLQLPQSARDADATSTALRGDRGDGMKFSMLFPAPVRPIINALAQPVGSLCGRMTLWNLRLPETPAAGQGQRESATAAEVLFSFSGTDGDAASGQNGFMGLGAAGYTTASTGAGFAGSRTAAAAASVRDPVAERRRARALQLLDAKLAQMGSSASAKQGGAQGSGSGNVAADNDKDQATPTKPAAAAGAQPASAPAGSAGDKEP
jgi:hypothetical protein